METKIFDKILEKFEKINPVQVNVSQITGGSSREWYYTPESVQTLFVYIVALREAYALIEENKIEENKIDL